MHKMGDDIVWKVDTESANVVVPRSLQVPRGRGYRHKMAYMIFTAYLVSYCLRFNLSMAMVGMVNDESEPDMSCPNLFNNSTLRYDREFDWDGQTQGFITGSFFIGYLLTQIPGGLLAQRYGGKWVIEGGVFGASVLTFLMPAAARSGHWWLIAVRALQGIAEGGVMPAGHVLLAQWTPPVERSQLVALALSGNQGGSCLAMLISGLMIYNNELEGWPGVFYICGAIGMIWCAFWALFAYNKPWDHPSIGSEELQYIGAAIGDQVSREYVSPPWLKILRSGAVWTLLVAQSGNGLASVMLLTGLPAFMEDILHLNLKYNSWVSGVPYFCMMIVAIISGYLATKFISSGIITTLTARRLFNTIGHWLPAVAFVALSFTDCNRLISVLLVFLAISLSGAVRAGYDVNHIDIAPQHAGVLMGLCNIVVNCVAIVSPYVMGQIRTGPGNKSLDNWNISFLIVAGIFFVTNLFYIIFATATEQSFNRPSPK